MIWLSKSTIPLSLFELGEVSHLKLENHSPVVLSTSATTHYLIAAPASINSHFHFRYFSPLQSVATILSFCFLNGGVLVAHPLERRRKSSAALQGAPKHEWNTLDTVLVARAGGDGCDSLLNVKICWEFRLLIVLLITRSHSPFFCKLGGRCSSVDFAQSAAGKTVCWCGVHALTSSPPVGRPIPFLLMLLFTPSLLDSCLCE